MEKSATPSEVICTPTQLEYWWFMRALLQENYYGSQPLIKPIIKPIISEKFRVNY